MTVRLPSRNALLTSILAALVGGASSTAEAKPVRTAFPETTVSVQGNGAGQLTVKAPEAIALERFHINVAHTANKSIRDIGVEVVKQGTFRAWFSDNAGRAPLTLRATWRSLQASNSVEVVKLSKICRSKRCRLGSVAVRSDKIPLLAGFVFHNIQGAQHIERVGITPERRTGPNRQVTYFANFDVDGRVGYTVDVNLILVDPSVVANEYSASARSEPNTGLARVPLEWENGLLALQGFDVRFLNGAHKIDEFGIVPVKGNNAIKAVRFNDGNSDDPIEAKLWWADLRGPGVKVIPMDKPLPPRQQPLPGNKPQLDPSVGGKGGKKPPSGKTTPGPKIPTHKSPSGKVPKAPSKGLPGVNAGKRFPGGGPKRNF